MGKKYIITESQERILTRLVERELGPEESVLVTKKNPFSDEKYVSARRVYSSNLKEGELFFTINKELKDYFYNKLKTILDGKTMRVTSQDGKDYVVKFIFDDRFPWDATIKGSKFSTSSKNLGSQALEDFAVRIDTTDTTWKQNTSKPVISFNSSKGGFYEITGEKYSKIRTELITVPDKTKINNAIFAFTNWNKIPDQFFEIRKVKRTNTDF